MAVSAPRLTPAHARRFRDEGVFVIEGAIPPNDLETRRAECQRFVDERDREMSRLGVDTLDLCHDGRRYFVHEYGKSPAVERFLFSDLMAQSAQAALGDTVHLCNEQYLVKAAERGIAFGWHQDSGFIPLPASAISHVLDPSRRRHRSQRHRLPAALPARRHPRRPRASPR